MRKLVAGLVCRAGGSRLFGKPLQGLLGTKPMQELHGNVTILDQILNTTGRLPSIETAVLGISKGTENVIFADVARARGISYIFGERQDGQDALMRLIHCGRAAGATDVFRVTTECPFLWFERVESAWREHVENENDITVTDGAPEGVNFEIYSMDALQKSYERGDDRHRAEHCSQYARDHMDEFRVKVIRPDPELDRLDIRLTVDNPEDLVLCRRVYERFVDQAPLIPTLDIIGYLDDQPALKDLVAPYVEPVRIWPDGNVT